MALSDNWQEQRNSRLQAIILGTISQNTSANEMS